VNEHGTVYLSFLGRITEQSTSGLLRECADLANAGVERVYLALSSPGGFVEPAIAAHNLLRGYPFHLVTHNVGSVDSMGNVLFLAGDERYACPNASFLFHGVGFRVSKGARFDLKQLREKTDSVETDQRKVAAILAQRTRIPRDEIDALFDEALRRDPDFARRVGIIDEIREFDVPRGARIVQLDARS